MIPWFAAGLKHPASARSSRSGEARGAAPFRSAVFARFVQAAPHTVGVEVLGVDRRTGLLPPGLVQTAGIDAIKAQFSDELQNDGLGCVVIARNWQGDAPGRACRPARSNACGWRRPSIFPTAILLELDLTQVKIPATR